MVELDAGLAGADDIEGTAGVDVGAVFVLLGEGGEGGEEEAGLAGRGAAEDFSDGSSGEVEVGMAGGHGVGREALFAEGGEEGVLQLGGEFSEELGSCGGHFRFLFAWGFLLWRVRGGDVKGGVACPFFSFLFRSI